MDHHQRPHYNFQNYSIRCINHFELCLLYQNHEIIHHFVVCMIQCAERANVLCDNIESGIFELTELSFPPVSEVHT